MKILAIETEIKKLNAKIDSEILKDEALTVLDLQQKDILREIYFDENHCAVLILECGSKTEAEKILTVFNFDLSDNLFTDKKLIFKLEQLR